MSGELRSVVVEMIRKPVVGVASRWVTHQWSVGAVAEREGGIDALTSDDDNVLHFDGLSIELHKSEAEGYWLNLSSLAPCVFVMWRQEEGEMPVPWVATVSYNEAGRMLDAGEKVENAPLSDAMRAWVKAFTDVHYVPEVRKKVKRNDPFKDGAFRRGVSS